LKLQIIIINFLEHWNTLDWLVTLFCMFHLPINSYLTLLCICVRVAYLGLYFVLPNHCTKTNVMLPNLPTRLTSTIVKVGRQ
jgi:hypothetical protein